MLLDRKRLQKAIVITFDQDRGGPGPGAWDAETGSPARWALVGAVLHSDVFAPSLTTPTCT